MTRSYVPLWPPCWDALPAGICERTHTHALLEGVRNEGEGATAAQKVGTHTPSLSLLQARRQVRDVIQLMRIGSNQELGTTCDRHETVAHWCSLVSLVCGIGTV
jgi:hypothetical protein